jgi:hypothetical protein
MTSTAIKFAGGVSEHDARLLAPNMRTTPEAIMQLTKTERQSYFEFYDKNLPRKPNDQPATSRDGAKPFRGHRLRRLPARQSRIGLSASLPPAVTHHRQDHQIIRRPDVCSAAKT